MSEDWDEIEVEDPPGYESCNQALATHFVCRWRSRDKPGKIYTGPVMRLELQKPGYLLTVLRSECHARAWVEYLREVEDEE